MAAAESPVASVVVASVVVASVVLASGCAKGSGIDASLTWGGEHVDPPWRTKFSPTTLGQRQASLLIVRCETDVSHLGHFSTSIANVRAIRCEHGQYRDPLRFGLSSDSTSLPGFAACGTIFGLTLIAAASTPA